MQELLPFPLDQLGYGDAGPPLHDPGDFLFRYLIPQHTGLPGILRHLLLRLQKPLGLGQAAIF